MVKATMMPDFDNGLFHERRKVRCPGCNGTMSEGAKLCVQCEAKARGKRVTGRWLELHEPPKLKRHQLFRAAVEAGYTISELVAMKTALPVEGRDYCRIGGNCGA
jgi:hypothetical protein